MIRIIRLFFNIIIIQVVFVNFPIRVIEVVDIIYCADVRKAAEGILDGFYI